MNSLKLTSRIGCRCYDSDVMEPSQGASPSAVLFLGASPPPWGGVFTDRTGKLVRATIDSLVKEEDKARRYTAGSGPMSTMSKGKRFMYSVHCHAGKLDKDIINRCAGGVTHAAITRCNPRVILAMGNDPLRSLGINSSAKKVRGHTLSTQINGQKYVVVPTISPVALIKDGAGLFSMFRSDIKLSLIHI